MFFVSWPVWNACSIQAALWVCSGSVMHRTLAPRQDGAMHQVSFAFIKGFT